MNYPKSFIDLIKKCQQNYPGTYIGTGNPEGKILIIGKECAIDSVSNHAQYVREIVNNLRDWLNNLPSALNPIGTQFNDVDVWVNPTKVPPTYNPLYPYKGQKHIIRREYKNGKISNPDGTCQTWFNYQSLYNIIIGKNTGNIDFHEDCFITELSQETAKYSHHKAKESRANINARQWIFTEDFFLKFPITIFACSKNYIGKLKGGIQSVIGSRWVLLPNNHNMKGLYDIYVDNNTNQILIITRQLSMNFDKNLIPTIASICKPYFKTSVRKLIY